MKNKRLLSIVLIFVLLLGCGRSNSTEIDYSNASDEEKWDLVESIASEIRGTVTGEANGEHVWTGKKYFELYFDPLENESLYNQANEAFGLTTDQLMEDYETFWDTIKQNYPYFGLLQRKGIDMDETYENGKKLLQAYPTINTLYCLIDDISFSSDETGHLSIINTFSYDKYKSIYSDRAPWLKVFEQDAVNNNSSNWDNYYVYLHQHIMDKYNVETESDDVIQAEKDWEDENNCHKPKTTGEIESNSEYPSNDNVVTNIVNDGQVACINIKGFETWEQDEEVLDEFMSQISKCSDLIIDIRNNGGGSDRYWFNLVSYLTSENMSYTKYGLTNLTDLNSSFIESAIGLDNLQPISELPDELNVEESDLDNVTHFIKEDVDVSGEKEFCGFSGNIWLITGSFVYSASEDFAMFCKQNGFATLIGTNTGGDGCCMDPINFALPNSGMIVRISTFDVLNPDGSNNEENGTTPDILLEDGDNAINAILDRIN